MRALALVLFGAAVAATACGEEPKAPTSTPASVELCQRPRSIDAEFHQGDKVADKTLVLTFDDGPAEVSSQRFHRTLTARSGTKGNHSSRGASARAGP
jgi:hypothetical protein